MLSILECVGIHGWNIELADIPGHQRAKSKCGAVERENAEDLADWFPRKNIVFYSNKSAMCIAQPKASGIEQVND
ncbi:hypothetical protein P5673_014105 [Acropora cervicornis]|uniref:Uncharacterized protein n=1 Tax=Acropora cervicornis TaxID=6130 RepID=A0AAD9QJR8_ACRCE|nr:hypothetical protein P5673_014105 [Acropora cervicornis]